MVERLTARLARIVTAFLAILPGLLGSSLGPFPEAWLLVLGSSFGRRCRPPVGQLRSGIAGDHPTVTRVGQDTLTTRVWRKWTMPG